MEFARLVTPVCLLVLAACSPTTLKCPSGTFPCGNGCIVGADAVCCDSGTAYTSSFCTNAGGGGCFPNTRNCKASFPSGAMANFCCGVVGSFGSNDCPAGQHHCGQQCFPLDHDCCPNGNCPESGWDPTGCSSANPSDVGCAVCTSGSQMQCVSCPAGSCCHGDPCASGSNCIGGDSCTGSNGGNMSMGNGSCPGGQLGSVRLCIQNGISGPCACNTDQTSMCITPQFWQTNFGGTFPASCAAAGASCVANDGRTVTAYCCPGLSCLGIGGPACGSGAGTCQMH